MKLYRMFIALNVEYIKQTLNVKIRKLFQYSEKYCHDFLNRSNFVNPYGII